MTVGREMAVEDVMAEVAADREFYLSSGGGLTLSGGEPLLQSELARELLRACKSEGIHTAIETNLAWPWERVASVLPATDLVMGDIKMMDAARHEHWTGVGNEEILENAQALGRGRPADRADAGGRRGERGRGRDRAGRGFYLRLSESAVL